MLKNDKEGEVDFNEALKLIAETPKDVVLQESKRPKEKVQKKPLASTNPRNNTQNS